MECTDECRKAAAAFIAARNRARANADPVVARRQRLARQIAWGLHRGLSFGHMSRLFGETKNTLIGVNFRHRELVEAVSDTIKKSPAVPQ